MKISQYNAIAALADLSTRDHIQLILSGQPDFPDDHHSLRVLPFGL
jgi:hypothetical protein